MKKLLLILFVVFFACFSIQGKRGGGVVIDRPLTWKDFKGKKPSSSPYKASTATIIGYEVEGYPENLSFKIYFLFSPKKSWVSKPFLKSADKKISTLLLKHEQGHYDIARVISWEMDKALNSFVYDKKKLRSQIDSIYRHFYKKEKGIQNLYDKQTDHSRVEGEQKKWDKVIAKALKSRTISKPSE